MSPIASFPSGSTLSSLSVVLPCRNEAGNVEHVVAEALRVAAPLAARLEVLVVDDASSDGTGRLVQGLARRDGRVRLLRRGRSVGYGAALRAGLLAARGRWVFYTDGDGQFPLGQLPAFLRHLDVADVVVGFRRQRRDRPARRWLGRGWTLLANGALGLGLRDVNCAFKVFPRALFERVRLRCDGAGVDAELMAAVRALGLRVAQVPVEHRPRRWGRSSGGRPTVAVRAAGELLSLAVAPPEPQVAERPSPGYAQAQTRLRPPRLAS